MGLPLISFPLSKQVQNFTSFFFIDSITAYYCINELQELTTHFFLYLKFQKEDIWEKIAFEK